MTRKQKILQRTRVGLGLSLGVASLLWLSSLSFGTTLTVVLAGFLSAWAIVEVERMGLFRSRAALVAAFAATFMAAAVALWLHGQIGGRDYGWRTYDSVGGPLPRTSWSAQLVVLLAGLAAGATGFWAAKLMGRAEARTSAAALPTWSLLLLVALPLYALVPIRDLGGTASLAAFIVLAKVGDVAGYYFGNWLGKTRPFPGISPGKTTAGCVASLVAGTLVGGGLVTAGVIDQPRFGVISGLLLGAVVNLTAQAGDLTESALKRRAGVKDSGTFFGPSGGLFDLVDSLILAAPVAAFVWPLLFD